MFYKLSKLHGLHLYVIFYLFSFDFFGFALNLSDGLAILD